MSVADFDPENAAHVELLAASNCWPEEESAVRALLIGALARGKPAAGSWDRLVRAAVSVAVDIPRRPPEPIPMRLECPSCHELHIDEGPFATKPHHTHACQSCGMAWRPAIVATVGVRFLPGFKNAPAAAGGGS